MRSQVQRLIQEFAGGGGDGVSGKGEVGAQIRLGQRYRLSERIRQSPEAYAEFGTIQLRRPRVRDTEEQFESRLLPLFVNRTRKVAELIPELYLHGLSEGDFDLALRGLWERTTGIGEHGWPVEVQVER